MRGENRSAKKVNYLEYKGMREDMFTGIDVIIPPDAQNFARKRRDVNQNDLIKRLSSRMFSLQEDELDQ